MIYIALLRGVNVGGKMVAMAELRQTLTDMGFGNVETLLQSGNVLFTAPAAKTASIERRLETAIASRLGVAVDVHVRTPQEWDQIIAANPFPREAQSDPSHLLVNVYREPLDPARVAAAQKAIPGRERLHAHGRHLYMVFPDGIGNSKAPPLVDRALGVRGTARNWNTIMKLAARAGSR